MTARPLVVVFKALCLFVVSNVLFGLIQPSLTKVNAYNMLVPGRVRFPFNDVMIERLDALFASHEISRPKEPNEYRVVVIGDSAVWGDHLTAQQSISVQWNVLAPQCVSGRPVRIYNLGYPHPSVIKDLMFLEHAMDYEPDAVVWLVTLNGVFPRRLQPFMRENKDDVLELLSAHHIDFPQVQALEKEEPVFYEKTLIGERSYLARWARLQSLSLLWGLSGEDVDPTRNYHQERSNDMDRDLLYRGMTETPALKDEMLFSALIAGHQIAGGVPVLLVNEPMFIANGVNSNVRYNVGYPRWAYDQYRIAMIEEAERNSWNYLDLWDQISPELFADSVLHLSAEGEKALVEILNPAMLELVCP